MGCVDELNMRAAIAAVNKWEKHCIATTDIDGPLSMFAKDLLIKTIFELLNESAPVVQAEGALDAWEERDAQLNGIPIPKKRRGRPPKCQSQPSMQPQPQSLDKREP